MLNSDSFLAVFSAIETWLRKQVDADRGTPFYQLVELASRKNGAVAKFRNDLKEFADLRNAIVHERSDGHVIAEPNEWALRRFEQIRGSLLDPPKLIPTFSRNVQTREATDHVGNAVADMRKGAFSQLPVLSGGKVTALLTAGTVVRWLASEVANGVVDLLDTKIEAVLRHTEDTDHYCFLARNDTLFDALSRFEDFASRGKDLDAILISQDGKPHQKLLGILTLYDLPSVLEAIGLKRISVT